MALKYWFEFTDVKTIVHRVEISDATFTGDSTQIYGSCSLDYSETKDTLEPVRGSGLQIDLEANSALTFYDLYSEEERTFSVVYTRANEILFNGWLSPEGIYESLVSDKWIISLDCTDGLGFLANLSYVEDATGVNFVGKQTLLEIVVNCLKRTKTPQNILTSVKIYYDGLDQTLNTFDNVYFNANRFIKDDKDTIMNCEEVLKSVLEPFGAVITSFKGEWLIYKPNSLVDFSSQIFFTYDNLGVALSPIIKTIDFAFDLGSQIDNYYPHHANGNQQKTIKSAIGAYRINYKYGLVKSFFNNLYLRSETTFPLLYIEEWTIDDINNLEFPANNLGFRLDIIPFSSPATLSTLVLTSDSFNFDAGNIIEFNSSFRFYGNNDLFNSRVIVYFRVVLTDGTDTYYLANNGEWINSSNYIFEDVRDEVINLKITSNNMPIAGSVKIEIWRPLKLEFPGVGDEVLISKCGFSPAGRELDDIKGENHTFQRELKPSSKIKDVKEVYNGDNPSDTYVGAIYKADSTTTTDKWTRQGAQETEPLLKIMGEERMKMYSKPLQVYKGDVYGYFNYLSLVTINGLTGKFMPTTYSYNALSNITSLELMEVLNTDILSDVDYQFTFDYGNVVEPTIKG
mgnify:CR=1 FL=1|tara:strand:+ start:942 stop:2819 length:1878 start_codon:yes stop_codon:yes gene_type:complete